MLYEYIETIGVIAVIITTLLVVYSFIQECLEEEVYKLFIDNKYRGKLYRESVTVIIDGGDEYKLAFNKDTKNYDLVSMCGSPANIKLTNDNLVNLNKYHNIKVMSKKKILPPSMATVVAVSLSLIFILTLLSMNNII